MNAAGAAAFFALLLLPLSVRAGSPTDITACDSLGCISEAKFSANISHTLGSNVVGYASIVGGLPPVFGGQARTASDPPSAAMSPDLLTNIASVSKVLTTIGIFQSLRKKNLTIDAPIYTYIYSDCVQGPNINTITFRDLLTHRAGIRTNCNGSNTTYAVLKALIEQGVNLADKSVATYNNCNFAIFRELLPAMEGHTLTNLTDIPRASKSASLYISYMNENVFRPLGIRNAQCMPPASGTVDILSYPIPAGVAHGTDWGDWTLACGGGGWVLSADEIFKVIDDLANGNVLLTSVEKTAMFTNCLGWDCSVRADCPNPYVCKNGALNNGNLNSISVWTYTGIFKCSVPVVVLVNSLLPAPYRSAGDIIGLVEHAYKEAAVVGTPKPCRQ